MDFTNPVSPLNPLNPFSPLNFNSPFYYPKKTSETTEVPEAPIPRSEPTEVDGDVSSLMVIAAIVAVFLGFVAIISRNR